MSNRLRGFNINLALAVSLAGLMLPGCAVVDQGKKAVNPKKEQSTIRLYLEGQHADQTTTGTVLVTRNKFPYTIEREAFLDESDLSTAGVVDNADGTYAIQLAFNEHGTLLLDMYTTSHKGKHIIIFSQFPKPGKRPKPKKTSTANSATNNDSDLVIRADAPMPSPGQTLLENPDDTAKDKTRESAWLAAVLIRNPIANGLLRFTPDASRAECLRIVRGLRNVLATQKKNNQQF